MGVGGFLLADTWLTEYAALCGSLVSLTAIVVLLAHFDGRPIFDSGVITLNTIVSIFSNISKGWLLLAVTEAISQWKWIAFSQRRRRLIEFEWLNQASRGPLGSLRLLFYTRGGSLASAGAFIVLLSIAIDPFIQQVIMFDTKLSFERNPTKNNVTIARAQRYSKGLEFTIAATNLEVGGQDFQAVQSTADFSMQSALLYGLTESLDAVTQQITFHCPTGNCKLEKFQSLAVCSVCNDVSSHVRKGRPQVTNPIFENLEQDNPGEFADNVTNATLPSGLFINEVDGWKFNDPQSTLMTTFSTGTPNETMTFKGKDALFWAMSIMKVSGNSSNASEVWPDLPVQATECGLWYCVNEYQTTITNGTVNPGATENRTATRSPKSFKSNNESETGMATLEFSGFRSSVKRTDLMLGDRFNISQNAVDSISSYLQTQFVANLSIKGLTGSVVNSSNLEYNPPAMQPLFDSGSLNDTFHSVAASMTNALRNGADHSNNATGIHANSVTFYSIQWPWMALPIALLFAGYGFLFLSHWETRKAGIPVWKSSDLAVLARGTHAQKILQGAYKPNEMRARSRKGYTHLFERDMVVDRGSEIDLRRMERDPTDEFSLAPSKRESDRFSHARTVSAESVTGSYSMAYHVHPPSPEIQGHSPL